MIRLSPQSHRSFSSLSRKLAWLLYIAGLCVFVWAAGSGYLKARSITEDQQLIEAKLSLVDLTETSRRGRSTVTFEFAYSFEVDGSTQQSTFSVSGDHAETYLGQDTVTVAYKASDPATFERLSVIEKNSSLTSVMLRFVIVIPAFALLVAAVYFLLTAKLVRVRESEPQLA